MSSSIIIDTCVMSLYDNPMDPIYKEFFSWITNEGTLVVSQSLLVEYLRTGNKNISLLIDKLSRHEETKRFIKITNDQIKNFKDDKHYSYSCNQEDINHAKLVFLSDRKKIVSHDNKLSNDINGFKKIDGIKPSATKHPPKSFYST